MWVDLGGQWHLSDGKGGISAPILVPGDGTSALHDAGLIPDPYFGRNEYDLRWICDRDWVINRSFVADRTDLVLVVSMLNTLAEVVVNGSDWQISIEAKALALFVAVEADVPGRFSINAFALFPGHPATVIFTPTTPGVAPNFTLRDLHSATYGPA